jgi:hypothetical protein
MNKYYLSSCIAISLLVSFPLGAVRTLDGAKKGKKTTQPTVSKGGVTKPQKRRTDIPGLGEKEIPRDIRDTSNKFCTYMEVRIGMDKKVTNVQRAYYDLAKKLENRRFANAIDIQNVEVIKYCLIKITDACK